ncbi:MAG: DUF4870 domain-containing protein [Planctomycetes bacterium]|nr:DUF4870 domain-containing protein [Planctomycetota bacterium]
MFDQTQPDGALPEGQARTWGLILHLSMLAGALIPLGGYIIPIVIWQMKKAEFPGIDRHGKNAVNWMITAFIFAVACMVLIFTVIGAIIGIPGLWVLGLISLAFPVVAAIKANNGEAWKYPLAFEFMK